MNNYHIYEEVGRGKYSVVYKGRVKKSIKYVAVKSVERSRRRKLMNEVRIFHDLTHKNVLKFFHWYETRNHLWIIFEYCAGGDLLQMIEQDKKLPEDTVRKFGYELVEGLSYLHSNGIIFADLKPSNVLINEYGVLKYADFGFAKKLTDFQGTQEASTTGSIGETGKQRNGTPYYMAPELFHDSGVHSFYSDFWSLGCILYEMTVGKPPFSSNSLKDLITLIVDGDCPIPLQGLSDDFNDLLRRMLEKDPIKRINWDELKSHPFWKDCDFTRRTYPPQLQFDAYLRGRGIVPEHFYDQRNNPFIKKLNPQSQQSSAQKVDILRLSTNVRRNIKREQDDEENGGAGGQYGQQAQAVHQQHALNKQFSAASGMVMSGGSQQQISAGVVGGGGTVQTTEDDVSLNGNRRMVLNFGEGGEEEEFPIDVKQPQGTFPPQQQQQQQQLNYLSGQSTPQQQDLNNVEVKLQKETKQIATARKMEPQPKQQQQLKFYPQPETQDDDSSPPQHLQHAPQQFDKVSTPILGQQTAKKPNPTTIQQHSQTQNIQQNLLSPQQQQLFSKTVTTQPISLQKRLPSKDLLLLINQSVFKNEYKPLGKPVDQLLIHNSDTAVKPIIGNKEIERTDPVQSQNFDKYCLSFLAWTPDQVMSLIETPDIEGHLNELYNSIASPQTTLNEKVHALLYFESIVINSQVSNRLINSAFMSLLVKLLKTNKTPQIRERVCSVIGLLIRHSTVIENDVAESDVCMQLVEVLLRDKQSKVRRKAVAALGEYMFYAATQLDDETADPCWDIKDEAIAAIVKSIRADSSEVDETVVFYSVKTLENITAQSNSAGGRFASVESANYLLHIFLGIHNQQLQNQLFLNENLRTSAAVALSHICRLQPKLFPLIFNKVTPKLFCYTLQEGQARVQQAFITLLNQALNLGSFPKFSELLLRIDAPQEQDPNMPQIGFLKCLVRLLDHSSIVIKGKVLLTFLLLFKQDFRWMALVDPEVKFFHLLDKLARDTYKYIQCCLTTLADGISEIIPCIFSAIAEELNLTLNQGNRQQQNTEFDRRMQIRQEFDQLQAGNGGNMIYIAIVLDLMQSQYIKQRIVTNGFVKSIATLIEACDTFPGNEEFLNALLLIVESVSSNQKLVIGMSEAITQYILPVLLQKTRGQSFSADIRFLSLKIFTDIVIQYLNDDSVYDPTQDTLVQDISENKSLGAILQTQLFPRLVQLIQDADPVPLFALKLLSAILDRNPILYSRVLLSGKQGNAIVGMMIEYYQPGHPRLNRHTINVLKNLIQSKELSLHEVQKLRLGEKTYTLLLAAVQATNPTSFGKQTLIVGDWCTEILLDVLQLILLQLLEVVKTHESDLIRLIDDALSCFEICVQLHNCTNSNGSPVTYGGSGQSDITTMLERASQCLILMLQLYALCQKKREIYFNEGHFTCLITALRVMSQSQQNEKKIIVKRVLKCIYWGLIQSEYQIRFKQDKRMLLEQIINQLLAQSDDRSILNTSKEIHKLLKDQYSLSTDNSSYSSQGNTPMSGGYQSNYYK